jgi:hypothetical protein
MSKQFSYPLTKFKGLSIGRVTLRLTTGADERMAESAASARNLPGQGTVYDELVRLAVVDYTGLDGVLVKPVYPFPAFNGWNKKTRDTVKKLFRGINGLSASDKWADVYPTIDGDVQVFDFSSAPLVDLKTIAIREVTGLDEEKAVRSTLSGEVTFEDAIVRAAIAKIDGADVAPGFDLLALNSRTRTLITAAYGVVNGMLDIPDVIEAEG